MNPRRFPGPIQFLLIGLCGLAIVLAPLMRSFLPKRFLYDDQHLQSAIDDPGYAPEDGSFHVLAQFYQAIGLDDSPALASTATMIVLVICVFLALDFAQWDRVGFPGAALLVLTLSLGLVYLAQFTKEFVSLLVALVVFMALRSPAPIVRALVIVGACLMYAGLVRPYWVLMAAFVPVVYFILRRLRNPLWILVAIVVAYIGLQVAFVLFRGEQLGATRAWVNLGRSDSPVATLISNPDFGPSPVAGVLSILVVAFFLLIPIPLFTMGSPYYLVAGLAIVALWSVVVLAIVRGRTRNEPRTAWLVAVLVSLLLVLVIFEPDYGSYLKHLTPLLPLFLALVPLRTHGNTGPADPPRPAARSRPADPPRLAARSGPADPPRLAARSRPAARRRPAPHNDSGVRR